MVFELTPLSLEEWMLPIGAAFLTLLIAEGIKLVARGRKEDAGIMAQCGSLERTVDK